MTTLAFAGAGRIATVHGLAAQVLGLRATHVASRRRENAQKLASALDASVCAYEDLPAGADLVVVSTPPARHVDDALRALHADAAALVEKPLATTLADADRLVAADEFSGGRVAYAENLAHAPVVVEALRRIRTIGPLTHLRANALLPRPDHGGFLHPHWGGGVTFDLGAHPVALLLLAASPERAVSVSAEISASPGLAVDDHGEIVVEFGSGLRARAVASWRETVQTWDLEAASATGVVRAELSPEPSLEHDGEPVHLRASRTDLPAPQLEAYGYLDQLATVAEDLAARRGPGLGAAFGRSVLEIISAGYASAARGGAPEALPFTGPRDATPLELWGGP